MGHATSQHAAKNAVSASEKHSDSSKKAASPWKLPYAEVDPLKLDISYKSTGVSVKSTKITTSPYKGKAETTSKDLIMHFTQVIAGRVSGFISNIEVLGLNVVDSAASDGAQYLGTFIFHVGPMLGPAVGPMIGVAAIAGVDAVKSSIAEGKRYRKVDEGSAAKPLDVIRGAIFSIHDAAKAGATARGSESSMVVYPIDAAVGTVEATGTYVTHNKTRLGVAAAGGGGMIVGAMVLGPVGAVIGGIATEVIAAKTVAVVEKKYKRWEEEQPVTPQDDKKTQQDDQKTST